MGEKLARSLTTYLLLVCLLRGLHGFSQDSSANNELILYVGSYTEGLPDKGIYIYAFNPGNGSCRSITSGENIVNPSFLTVSKNGKYIYACTETKTRNAGSVSAFVLDYKNKTLHFLNKQPSMGENPVYVSLDENEKHLVNANYTEGGISVYDIAENNFLLPASQAIHYSDSSINKERQSASHAHAAVFSPSYNFLFVTDLGADKIRSYKVNHKTKPFLETASPAFITTVPGSGPRHFTFHPGEKFAYCIEELSETVTAYSYRSGILKAIQRISTRDTSRHVSHGSADIHISPDGKFLYASNRGDKNTITIYSIQENGTLNCIGYQSTLGEHPRNFCIDPTGSYLLVANTGSDNIVIFRRDKKTGLLEPTGNQISVPRPSCLQMRYYSNK